MDNNKLTNIAKNFWIAFQEKEKIIYTNLLKRNESHYNKSVTIITNIKLDLGIIDNIGTYLSIDTRNGMELSERKNYVEFILTPLFRKSNIELLNALYNEYLLCKLPKYWNIIKYKFFQPELIQSITLNYEDEKKNIVEITKDNFMYYPIINDEKTKINILLFITDNISQHIVNKENYNNRDIFIPSNTGINAILDSSIGEYNMINKLDKMEIHLESDLLNKDFKDIVCKNIEHLHAEFEMLNNNPMSGINKCSRCYYASNNVKLYICKCKKTYYCDTICQRACYLLHKDICI